MAENQLKVSNKAAKKNKKRNISKKSMHKDDATERETVDFHYMLAELKKQLAEAKSNKEHKRGDALRNKIWVLTDLIAGVKTDIPEDELDEILTSIHAEFNSSPSATSLSESSHQPSSVSATVVEDKRLRNLRKKLDQIEALKERHQRGEVLEANQIAKMSSEEQVREEIKELEQILAAVTLSHQ